MFVGGPPLTAVRATQAVRGLTPEQFAEAIDTLIRDYRRQGRPYTIRSHGEGYILALRPKYQPIVDKLYGTAREARLSAAAIDVLSLVAYRQPATKQEIDSLRGAECGALLRQLVRRGLIAVVHRAEAGKREVSFGTTARFLKLFGLKSLDDFAANPGFADTLSVENPSLSTVFRTAGQLTCAVSHGSLCPGLIRNSLAQSNLRIRCVSCLTPR